MIIFLIFNPTLAFASDFDTLLSECIDQKGLYSDKHGIICSSTIENGTMLAVISAENNAFIINVYGAENEPADSLQINYNSKSTCCIGVTNLSDDFCVTVQNGKKHTYYRLVNDAFTISSVPPESVETVAKYKSGQLRIYTKPSDIYSLIDSFKLERINHIPNEEMTVSANDKALILSLLRSCTDIYEYNASETDSDALMRKVLYTHRNFQDMTSSPLISSEKNKTLKLCNEEYISSVLYNVFRKTAPRPAVNMLTEIGYCYNNGYYYYTGGYTGNFRTEIHDILKIFRTDDNSLYVVFSDTYTENGKATKEYSSAVVGKDDDGYYITSLKMSDDFKDLSAISNTKPETNNTRSLSEHLKRFLPFIIMLFTLAAVCTVIYFYIIR